MAIFFRWILVVALLLPAGLSATSLWEVRSDNHSMVIGATLHFLREQDFPLPASFDKAYQQADTLYLEADVEQTQSLEFMQRLMASMLYTDGRTLRDDLSPENWQRLVNYARASEFPLEQLLMVRAALLTLSMTVHEFEQYGFVDGVDDHYYNRARQQGKPVGFLESVDVTLAFLETLNELDANDQVAATLDSFKQLDELMERGVTAWRQGDMDALYEAFEVDEMQRYYPDIYRVLIHERHQAWWPVLEGILSRPGRSLVLVGALHVSGPDSLLMMLEEAGYQVRQLD